MMYFNEYTTQAIKTAVFPQRCALEYLTLGLMNEAGEVGGKVKKMLRGDYDEDKLRDMLQGELGDVLWYLAVLTQQAGLTLEDVAKANLEKLMDRKDRGVLKGNGDNR
jgi:NTP pyrophosphatase (non-canonical NTP hydrolase)